MSRSLAVDADLLLTHDDEEIAVRADGSVLVVDAPSYSAVRSLFSTVTALPAPPAELFGVARSPTGEEGPVRVDPDTDLDARLDRHGLTVEVRIRDATVARLGASATPTGWRRRLAALTLGVPAAIGVRRAVVAAVRRVG